MSIRHELWNVVAGIVGGHPDVDTDDIVDAIIDSGLMSQAAVRFLDHIPADPQQGIETSCGKRIVLEPGESGTYLSIWEPARVAYPARSLWANLSPRAADQLIDALTERRHEWGRPVTDDLREKRTYAAEQFREVARELGQVAACGEGEPRWNAYRIVEHLADHADRIEGVR